MKSKLNKFLSVALTLCMMVSMLPSISLTAFAAVEHSSHDGFSPISGSGEDTAIEVTNSSSASIYLSGDSQFGGGITIDSGCNLTLCLNGKTLDLGKKYITNNGTLTICDCNTGGIITTTADNCISNKGTLNISGGTIKGSISTIYNSGTITMSGGTVEATANDSAKGIYNGANTATVTMSGGTVKSTATDSSSYGISIGAGKVDISGGTVSSGSPYAIYLVTTSSSLYLSGSPTITYGTTYPNDATHIKVDGGAIYAHNIDDTADYSGDTLTITSGYTTLGNVIVYDVTDQNEGKFTLHSTNNVLARGTGDNADDLVISEAIVPHKHGDVTFDKWTATGGTISTSGNYYLADNLTATSNIIIDSSADVTLCLNGKTLDMGSYYVGNKGTLTICDCQTEQGTITGKYGIYNADTGSVTVSGGTVSSAANYYYGIYNNSTGSVTVSGGTVLSGENGSAIYNNSTGSVTVSGGTVTGTGDYGFGITNAGDGSVTVSGGTVSGSHNRYGIENTGGSVTVSGGTISGGYGIYNKSTASITVTDGKIEASSYGIYHQSTGSITVSGGTISGVMGIFVAGNATVHLSGGTIKSTSTSYCCIDAQGSDSAVYLSGTVIESAGPADICISGNGGTRIYAHDSTNTTAYSGGKLAVKLGYGFETDGRIVIYDVNDSNKDKFSLATSNNFILKQNGNNLILAVPHTHSWKYTKEDNATIKAECIGTGTCNYSGTDYELTIIAPAKTTYGDAGSAAATLSASSIAGQATLPTIMYTNRTTYDESDEAPTAAGKYSAEIAISEVTVFADYEIAKATVTNVSWPTGLKGNAGEKLSTITLPDGFAWINPDEIIDYDKKDYAMRYIPADTNYNSAEAAVSVEVDDEIPPTGTISIGDKQWNSFIEKENISFTTFFNAKQTVTITVEDNQYGSGVDYDDFGYYIASEKKSIDELSRMTYNSWTDYTGAFDISPNRECIIYTRFQDNDNNMTYLSSDGIVLDKDAPAISGIENGETYCGDTEVTVSDAYFDKVEVDGNKAEVTDGKFTVSPAIEAQEIIAYDKAGNTTTFTITVNDGHTYVYDDSAADTIVEKCGHCDYNATAEISAPTGTLTYDGTTEFEASVTYSDEWAGGKDLVISYTRGGNGTNDLKSAGEITASITKGGETASVTYTVAKATATNPEAPTASSITYGQTLASSTLTDGWEWADTTTVPPVANSGYIACYEIADDTNYDWSAIEGYDKLNHRLVGMVDVTVTQKEIGILWTAPANLEYDGNAKKPTATATGLVNGDNVNITATLTSGNDNVNAGSFTYTATAIDNDNYTLPDNATSNSYTITARALVQGDFSADTDNLIYSGTAIEPSVSSVNSLVAAGDFDIAYENNINAGESTAKIKITGKANASGTVEIPFTIEKADYNMTGISFTDGEFTYDGEAHSLVIGGTLPTGADGIQLTAAYSGSATNVADGEVTVTAAFATESTNYNVPNAMTAKVKINAKDITNADITLGTALTYTGSKQTQEITSVVIDGLNATYTASGNAETNAGDYTLTITGITNFAGTATKDWSIAKAVPEFEPYPMASRVLKGRELSRSKLEDGVAKGVDGAELAGTFAWKDGTEELNTKGTFKKMVVFTPEDANYSTAEFEVDVDVYVSSGVNSSTAYTVKFDTKGGSKVDSETVYRNTSLDEPSVPTREGYIFGGWYTDKSLTEEYDFDKRIANSFTLYAKWIEADEAEPEPDEGDGTGAPEWNPFDDVTENDWFHDAVKEAYLSGLVTGTSENTFSHGGDITRGMFVTILYRAEGEPTEAQNASFLDIEPGAYYEKAVDWGAENGVILGFSETEYAPDKEITREQMAAILYRYAQLKGLEAVTPAELLGQFADSESISEYAVSALNWAVGAGVISGKGNGILDPLGNATRAEATAMLVRLINSIE